MTALETANLAQVYADSLIDISDDETKAKPTPIQAYAKSLRDVVRGLWQGRFDRGEFGQAMFSVIERHFDVAWQIGAKKCGVTRSERIATEQAELNRFIDNQVSFIPRFAQFIEENSKENKGLLRTSLNRLPPWINRFNEVTALAQQITCEDIKLVWLLGQTIEHCKTCLKLNGRVMLDSRWRELDVHPQDTRPGKLECNGYNCDCRLVRTDKRATPGKLPRLP